jgi:hypothetical protein
VDLWAHGDPALGTQYHVALGPDDWKKFTPANIRKAILPQSADTQCFNADGSFITACAANQPLDKADFELAASFLATAANKTGKITVDLVQYTNRIMKITKDTSASPDGGTKPPANLLSALVRDCWPNDAVPPVVDEANPVEPTYGQCTQYSATSSLPNWALFTAVQEKFVSFAAVKNYNRDSRFDNATIPAIVPPPGDPNPQTFTYDSAVEVLPFLYFANGTRSKGSNIVGFVYNASDALRTVEFIHNYAVPTPLWDFVPVP